MALNNWPEWEETDYSLRLWDFAFAAHKANNREWKHLSVRYDRQYRDPVCMFRNLCYLSYIGHPERLFVTCPPLLYPERDLTAKEILDRYKPEWRDRIPKQATKEEAKRTTAKSAELEVKCAPYVPDVYKQDPNSCFLINNAYPVEIHRTYLNKLPLRIFTAEELDFMETNPLWLLPLRDPEQIEYI